MKIDSELSKTLAFASAIILTYETSDIIADLDPRDDMGNHEWDKGNAHYLHVGRQALDIIIEALVLTEKQSVSAILDFPCGFGRVARHLRAAFPDAALICSDLYQDRVDYCAEKFGATGLKSKENYDELGFPRKFDLIWVGSLLSHMPEPLFKKAINLFSRSLNTDGIAIFTTQGRHAPYIQKNLWKFMDDEKFVGIEADFEQRGFGFADYNAKQQFFEQQAYGITLASPSFVMKCLEQDNSIRIQALLERRWDQCQDVVVFKKAGIHDKDVPS